MTSVKNIYDYINKIAPYAAKEDWDNTGFLVGDFRKEVKRVVMCLDATNETCEYAAAVEADLLLTHHPIIFKGVKSVEKGTGLYTLIKNDIAHISAHTNYDVADEGINFNLAKLLELSNIRKIENSFIVVGEIESEMSIDDLALFVSQRLECNGIRYTDTDKLIKTIALGGGACEEYADIAMANADCFLTGDMKYHSMLDAAQKDFAVISAGHFETENLPFLMLKDKLEQIFVDVEFLVAPAANPIHTV